MGNKLKILFLASWFPYPPDNGSRQRTYHLLHGLAGHEITLIALTDPDQISTQIPAVSALYQRVIAFPRKPFLPRRFSALRAFLSPRPRYIVDTYDPAVSSAIHNTMRENQFDAIVASELSMAVYAVEINHPHIVFDDVEVGIFRDAYENKRGFARWRHQLTWFKHKSYMQQLVRPFQILTVVSGQERERVRAMGIASERIAFVPNGVDCDAADSISATVEPFSLIYNGAITFAANLEAIRYFVREILPLVRAAEPAVKLRITGRADQVAQNDLSEDNVVLFTGYVPDVKPLVKASAVCIVPLRRGGGTRLKILEAMALCTPVVATTKGAEGLNVRHGEHLLIADSPRAFADAVLELLHNSTLRGTLTATAYARVRAEYDWKNIGLQFNRMLVECAPPQTC